MMMLFIGTHSVTTTLNVHSRSRSFVIAIDLRGLAPSMRLFRRDSEQRADRHRDASERDCELSAPAQRRSAQDQALPR